MPLTDVARGVRAMMISIFSRLRDIASVCNWRLGCTIQPTPTRPLSRFVRSFALFPAFLLAAHTTSAKTPDLDGSWLLEYGGTTVEVAMWAPAPIREGFEVNYHAVMLTRDQTCTTISSANYVQYDSGPKSWMKFPAGIKSPDQPHVLMLSWGGFPTLNSLEHTEFSERFQNNCKMESATGASPKPINAFRGALYYVGNDRWEGEVRTPAHNWSWDNGSDFQVKLTRTSASPEMLAILADPTIYLPGVPRGSIFAGLRSTQEEIRKAQYDRDVRQIAEARAMAASPAGYLQAIMDDDRQVIGIADRKFAEPYVRATGSRKTDAYRNLESLLSGRGFATEAQQEAMKDYYAEASLLPAVYVTYLFDFERRFPTCMQGKRTVEIPWQEVTTTTWPDGGETKRVSASGKIVHSVPGRLFDRLLKIANTEPAAGVAADSILGMMAPDSERISTGAIIRATSVKMSSLKCGSPEQVQFEKNLFALYDEHWRAQERRLNIFYSN